ncbi:uncharacterized protein LOC123401184 [Hordeum vulgare subsp. vulgare]|uniref:Uncharacterized protein n=1 Tax=Hordeum vulgare subsp. vulgare TaxID=112509 RepID=M0YX33_HORVV|nr:uncharacterized protein LOC123401184 [Hordeum vulgare subsp. vulgare]KAI4967205.1 hypothetical protein ZWY2020_029501 [Hordeum vulgare]
MEGKNPKTRKDIEEKYVLGALIEHSFNFFFVVILCCYIFLIWGALKYYKLLYAVAAIAFMSPYFIMMLQVLPFLKGFYIEKYATAARDVGLTNNVANYLSNSEVNKYVGTMP